MVISSFRKHNIGHQRDDRGIIRQCSTHFQNTLVVAVEPLNLVRGPSHTSDARWEVEHGEVQCVTWILAHPQNGGVLLAPLLAQRLEIYKGVGGRFTTEQQAVLCSLEEGSVISFEDIQVALSDYFPYPDKVHATYTIVK